MALLEPGQEAPDFEALDQHGQPLRLRDLRGRALVLYFYPVDDTPGCTAEACGFRDDRDAWRDAGAEVVGVSTQDVASHARFAAKHRLGFRLAADPSKAITRAYGALGLTGVAKRVTYLIDAEGRVLRVWPKVSPREHSREVREALLALRAGRAA